MKILICGAGQVGYNIASYLSDEGNNVTIVDNDPVLIAKVNDELDVNGIVGYASSPEVLDSASAEDCELMIAVTRSDEVNMVACQIGHSFSVFLKKVARVRQQDYLQPAWSNLFSRTHMPIDMIISPEFIVAQDIYKRLLVPGTTYVSSMAAGKLHLLGIVCDEDCPLNNTVLAQIKTLFPDLNFKIIAILRRGETLIADDNKQILEGDEIFLAVDTAHIPRVISAFGRQQHEARRIVIAGGGSVARGVVSLLQEREGGEHIKIIEHNKKRANTLSKDLGNNVIVLNGSALEKDILEQASISRVDSFIAVTNDDETNILASLLAKQYGAERSITLVNNNAYSPLVGPLGVDAMVSPRAIIVATIMQYVRKGRIKEIHNLRHGFAEVMEAEVTESATIANKTIEELSLPDNVMIVAIIREGEMILPTYTQDDIMIKPADHVIVMVPQEHAQLAEKLFSVHVDIF